MRERLAGVWKLVLDLLYSMHGLKKINEDLCNVAAAEGTILVSTCLCFKYHRDNLESAEGKCMGEVLCA